MVEAARSARYGHRLALCVFDLDGFKAVNDRLGHPEGDGVLKGVAKVIDSSRLTDDAFRIGGDEFAVLMPQTTLEGGKIAAERLVETIAGRGQLGDGAVTASYGVAATVGDALSLHDGGRPRAAGREAAAEEPRSQISCRASTSRSAKTTCTRRASRKPRRPSSSRARCCSASTPSASPRTTSPTR